MMHEDTTAGILVTVIVHLAVTIVLLSGALKIAIQDTDRVYVELPEPRELTEEEREELEQLAQEKKALEEALFREQIRQEVLSGEIPRNTSVNRGQLKDDRNTDVDQLEKDRQRVENQMKDNLNNVADPYQYTPGEQPQKNQDRERKSYSGPGMIEYDIPGWSATYLYPPGYTKFTGGKVVIAVTLNAAGKVSAASILSSSNASLNQAALSAAKRSSFSGGQAGVNGTISYTFIAQ